MQPMSFCKRKRRTFPVVFFIFCLTFLLLHISTRSWIPSGIPPTDQIIASETSKVFLYLTQTESCIPQHLKDAKSIGNSTSCNCDVLILGYKSLCKETSLEHVQYVYDPKTTWSTGRNLLYDIAMKRPTKYLYYIFMDDDITLKPTWKNDKEVNNDNAWRVFERFLLAYTPPVGITGYCSSPRTPSCTKPNKSSIIRVLGVFDAAFNAFHIKTLPYLMPYVTKFENISWWYSQHYLVNFASVNFKGEGVVSEQAITALNIKHKHPRKAFDERPLNFIKEDVVQKVKQKKLPEVVWQGKRVTQAVQRITPCKCYS